MIRHVFMDLDNTLLDFSKAEAIAVKKTLNTLGIECPEAVIRRYSQLNLAQWKLLELGTLTREQGKIRRYQLLFNELGTDASPQEAARIYEELLAVGHYFIDGAEWLLDSLYGRYKLYLATNGTAAVQNSRLKSAGIRRYFEYVFISEELDCNKPSKDFFERCFQNIPDFKTEEAVMVGDSLSSDILGGINAGIKTVWFNQELIKSTNIGAVRPDCMIKTLKELPGVLETM